MHNAFLFICIHCYSALVSLVGFLGRLIKPDVFLVSKRSSMPSLLFGLRGKEVVWLHASSIGEVKVLLKFMSILENKYPDTAYVVTAFTANGLGYLQRYRRTTMAAVGFIPLDTVSLMNQFVKQFSIRRVWVTETEIWPSMLWVCRSRNIPVGMVNARMEQKSYRAYCRFGFVLKPLFRSFDCLLVQDESYAARFRSLGVRAETCRVVGNIKSRVIIASAPETARRTVRRGMMCSDDDVIITVGCLHPAETAVIAGAIAGVEKRGYHWKWIIVPRHPEKSKLILAELDQDTLHVTSTMVSVPWKVCLIEKIGILEDMYMIADGAVLGGTFNDVGGHNVWEAAQFAIPVFFGPDYHTQQQSCERILDAGVGLCVSDADQLTESLIETLLRQRQRFTDAQKRFIEVVKQDITSLERVIP